MDITRRAHLDRRRLNAVLEGGMRPMPAAPDGRMLAETVACVVGWFSRYEDTYIAYFYEVDGAQYSFVYVTPYDELHRAYGHHPPEWYDALCHGTTFAVGFDPDDPREHRVLEPRFDALNGKVCFVGETPTTTT